MRLIPFLVTTLILFISTPSFAQQWYELEWREYDSRIDSFGVTLSYCQKWCLGD